MFDSFSVRARRIVFFSRKFAGRRGASAIEVEHLMEALVLEDQADYDKVLPDGAVPVAYGTDASGKGAFRMVLPAHRPFFTPEVGAEIQRGLESLMVAKVQPLPDSVDMPLSDACQRVLMGAKELSKASDVQPLHLLAAILDEASLAAEVLKQAGIAKEAVIAAIKSGEYF